MSVREWEAVEDLRRNRKPLELDTTVVSSGTMYHGGLSRLSELARSNIARATDRAGEAVSNTYSYAVNIVTAPTMQPARYRESLLSPILRIREEKVERVDAAIDELIGTLDGGQSLSDRLHELVKLANDEYPETDIPSSTTVAALRRFFLECGGVAAPRISLLPSGAIWLSWARPTAQAGLSIFRDGTVSFGLLLTGAGRPTHVNFAGTLQSVVPRILAEQSARWMFP